jgi:hypothetical protein
LDCALCPDDEAKNCAYEQVKVPFGIGKQVRPLCFLAVLFPFTA